MTVACILKDRTVLSIVGDDSADFITNVFTCNIESITSDNLAYGALLTPQGKVLFDAIFFAAPNGYHLVINNAIVTKARQRLMLYKLRAKVDFIEQRDNISCCWLPQTPDEHVSAMNFLAIGKDPRHHDMGALALIAKDMVNGQYISQDDEVYHKTRVSLGIAEAIKDYPSGEIFPYNAAIDLLGGIDFSKGCYIGQEVISRMKHRGNIRRRVLIASGIGNGTEHNSYDGVDGGHSHHNIIADGREIGFLGQVINDKSLAFVRLDRLQTALATQANIHPANDNQVKLVFALPVWADYNI